MNDRELLKAAAKAAGYPAGRHVAMDGLLMANDLYWNPLTDDGDALRLAVKLRLEILSESMDDPPVMPTHVHAQDWGLEAGAMEPLGDDPYAATRRAITRAAAEIGRANDDQ